MSAFSPASQNMTSRAPATAILAVDSVDRLAIGAVVPGSQQPVSYNFTIQKPNSILNGFFNRIATSEIVLEWQAQNVSSAVLIPGFTTGNNTFTWATTGGPTTITIPTGWYNVNALGTQLAALMTAGTVGGTTWTWAAIPASAGFLGGYWLLPAASVATLTLTGAIWSQLAGSGFSGTANAYLTTLGIPIINPDLRPVRYLDFVCNDLTYNQALKDDSTSSQYRDNLCRWYFAWADNAQPTVDAAGYPILMGYTPFVARRLFSPPKLIRWDARMPLGNLKFQVYNDSGTLATLMGGTSEFLLTLLASEE